MKWIHEQPDWPNFTWDSNILFPRLASVRYRQGLLLGRMSGLGFELRQEASLHALTKEIVKSSAIEGEILEPEDVRSSIAIRLGIDIGGLTAPNRDVDGIVEVMLDATQNYSAPLTTSRLFQWHAALFPTGRSGLHSINVGKWRPDSIGPMQVVSGPIGRERVHFEAPSAGKLASEMSAFLSWFENSSNMDPILKAAIAHFWFVTIHPFEDGNGRIARAIADMALAQADDCQQRFYSMASQIESERKNYYSELEKQQRLNLDITRWLDWFLNCLEKTLLKAEDAVSRVFFKAQLWKIVSERSANDRQKKVLNRMLDEFKGHMNTSKYAKLAKCSNDTALRDIKELLHWGILLQNPGKGRSTSYRLITVDEIERLA